VTAEAADKALRDMVIEYWQKQGCESADDTLKMASLVEWFIPYFPLQRSPVRQVFQHRLLQLGAKLAVEKHITLSWESALLDFLVGKVFLVPLPGNCCQSACHTFTTCHTVAT
jgi:hypothetical protein